ncbi:CHAT domain-containing protein [Ferrimonas balearica]|uniref:CHAT domain-containing protein n=1 Tax=Ferrimonas balearica TaxID=44012 RepID=UPI001C55A0F1|nr:CHAT domain-containing protein [Ferrimonas balearica]MBW3140288.1 CHAT domain-containing protein [Ferrimonas balearica]
MTALRLLAALALVAWLPGCSSLDAALAMNNGTEEAYIQKHGGKAAFNTMAYDDLIMLCGVYASAGKMESANQCFQAHIRRFEQVEDPENRYYLLSSYGAVADYRMNHGDLWGALALNDKVLTLSREPELASSSLYGGWARLMRMLTLQKQRYLHQQLGQPEQSAQAEMALDEELVWLRGEPRLFRHTGYSWLANGYEAMGEYQKAANLFLQDEDTVADTLADTMDLITSFGTSALVDMTQDPITPRPYYLALGELAQGRSEAAIDHLNEFDGEEIVIRSSHYRHWSYFYHFGRAYRASGQPDLAISKLERAVEIIESQRRDFSSDHSKMAFANDKQKVYALLIDILVEQGQAEQALSYAEKAKSRALVDMLASRETLEQSVDPRASQLLKAAQEYERTQQKATSDDRTRSNNVAAQQLRSEYPELASLVNVDSLDVAAIRARLGPEEVMLEYYWQGDQLVAFVLSAEQLSAVKLDAGQLDQRIAAFREALMLTGDEWREPAQALYQQLLAPVEAALVGQELLVVPHGSLHYLPFNALHDGRRFVVDRWATRLLPSASVLAYLGKQQASGRLLVLGNPDLNDAEMALPGAEYEAQVIARQWQQGQVLLREQATETAVRQQGPQYAMLHFASHGEFNASNPLDSRLMLAADAQHDGSLTLGELYGLQLNADLVTLSACETGLGDVRSGDDVVGLNRGFLFAGADSVVSSLWPVEDTSTAFLMADFYARLKGGDKVVALREAQMHTREKYPHPFYWAAFQLTGESR